MSTVTVGKTAIDKRKLRDYEPPKVRCKNQGFTVHAEVYKDFLCVNFYLDGLYDFTVFCSDDAYVTKNRSLSKGWTDGCLYNLIDWQPEYGDTTAQGIKISYADRKSAKVGADFYGKKNIDTLSAVHNLQLRIRPAFIKTCFNNPKMADITEDMTKVLPDAEAQRWADDNIMGTCRYGYARRHGKKIIGFCSHCGKDTTFTTAVKGQIADKKGKCQNCKSVVTFRTANFKRQDDRGFFQEIVPMHNGIAVKQWDIIYKQRQSRVPQKTYECHEIEYISSDLTTAIYSDLTYSAFGAAYCKWSYVRGRQSNYYGYYRYYGGSDIGARPLCPIKIDTHISGTPFCGMYLGKTALHTDNHMLDVDKYITHFADKPVYESAIKIGLYNLCAVYLDKLCTSEKSLKKALGVSSPQLKQMCRINATKDDYNIIKLASDNGIPLIADKLVKRLAKYSKDRHIQQNIENIFKTLHTERRLDQLCDYLDKNPDVVTDYGDYLVQLQKLHRDTTQASELFPKNFSQRHADFAAQIEFKHSAKINGKIEERANANASTYECEIGSYIFKLPHKAEEIIKEGKILHHCVGTYCDKVADGECVIVFCRKKENPDKPFATGEFIDGKSIQFRANANGDPPQSAIDAWEALKKRVEKSFKESKNKEKREINDTGYHQNA